MGKSTTTSYSCAQAEKTRSTERGEVPARKSSDETPSTAAERDVRSPCVRADWPDRGASQLHLHNGRHSEWDDLLGAGQEQEGGKEGSGHLGGCRNLSCALSDISLVDIQLGTPARGVGIPGLYFP